MEGPFKIFIVFFVWILKYLCRQAAPSIKPTYVENDFVNNLEYYATTSFFSSLNIFELFNSVFLITKEKKKQAQLFLALASADTISEVSLLLTQATAFWVIFHFFVVHIPTKVTVLYWW